MADVSLVEYDHSWASAVSDMWTGSNEGWNGNDMSRSSETVIREHDNASYLHVYLAVLGDKVIGYLSLSKYALDEDALYIHTLNVRTDYHGKKVGKLLVIRAVELAIEQGWSRVDLFTWPGNHKAVPLYKKCGFFWEKRDDSTHLMNFIPTVLSTEAVRDFFDHADWYRDSVRPIRIEPDDRQENNFDYFEYAWDKNGETLRVEFERTSRGMRLIETNDYLIQAQAERHEAVFGNEYKVVFDAVNKTGKPLKICIRGIPDKNIEFHEKATLFVDDRETIEMTFTVGQVTEEQSPYRTHPAVTAILSINGKQAIFRLGILPVFPVNLALQIPGGICYTEDLSECILEIKNNYPVSTEFSFAPADTEWIFFCGKEYRVETKPGEQKTLSVTYILKAHGYYSAHWVVTARPEESAPVVFEKKLNVPFRGVTGMFHGESETLYEIINGPFQARLYKHNNALHVAKMQQDTTIWNYPKVGRPYSIELSRKKPSRFDVFQENRLIGFRARYDLEDHPGLVLTMVCRLDASGLFTRHFEVQNTSGSETTNPVCLSDPFFFHIFRGGVFPYEGTVVELKDSVTGWINNWNSDRITGNWMFSQGRDLPRGFFWDPEDRIRFETWRSYFDHNLGRIPPETVVSTRPVTLVMGLFQKWEEFRGYVLGSNRREKPVSTRAMEFTVNGNNPFLPVSFQVSAQDHRIHPKDITFRLSSERETFPPLSSLHNRMASFSVRREGAAGYDVLRLEWETDTYRLSRRKGVFHRGEGTVKTSGYHREGREILRADNGMIQIEADPGHSFCLHSMIFNGREWLDSQYPEIATKAWWNPWIGGLGLYVDHLSTRSLLEEKREGNPVQVRDSLGNLWQGIQLRITVEQYDQYKGMVLDLHYLMLPGVPAICFLPGIRQYTGRFLKENPFLVECFLQPGTDIRNSVTEFVNLDGDRVVLKAGAEQYFMGSRNPVEYRSEEHGDRLFLCADPSEVNLETRVSHVIVMAKAGWTEELWDGEYSYLAPVFLLFGKESVSKEELEDLYRIRFHIKDQNAGTNLKS